MNRDTAGPDAAASPGPNAKKWVKLHHKRTASSEYSHELIWDVTAEANGLLVTSVDGNVLLGFTCHIGVAPFGYNNEKILSKSWEFDLVEPVKIAEQSMYFGAGPDPETVRFPRASHLMDKLTDVPSHYRVDAMFLSNSGAEIVEDAMKITYDHEAPAEYGHAFEGSFHGRMLGTLSLMKSKEVYTHHYPQAVGTETVPFCAGSGYLRDDDVCGCGFLAGNSSRLRNPLSPEGSHVNLDEVALAVLEPIQGIGGHCFPSEVLMTEVDDVCDTHDIPLVVDEIQSGVGRAGEMWAVDHHPIKSDVIASAKGFRVGTTASRTDVFPTEKNRLGSAFGGGDLPASMQDAFTLGTIEEHDLLDNTTEYGRQVRELFTDDVPDYVVDVRGKGLIFAVELDTKKRRDAVVEAALDRGLFTLGCKKKTIRLPSPLDSTEREIELSVGTFCEAMDAVATEAVM